MPKKSRRPKRELRPVLHIFCEGEKTEPNYLKGYMAEHCPRTRTTKVIRVEPTKKTTPKQLVDEAVKKKRDPEVPKGDSFWVVYDRESEGKYPPELHAQARQKAEKNNVKIALSNVCFEVWLLLHFQEHVAGYDCFDDLNKRSDLRKHLTNYDKSERNIFELCRGREGVEAARTNAPRMNEQTQNAANRDWDRPDQWNPYTNVYELLDEIDEFGRA